MTLKDNEICFKVENNQVTVTSKTPVSLENLMRIVMTGLLGAMNSLSKVGNTKSEKKLLKEYIYDRFNLEASHVLEVFAPEIEMRPSLTTDAIIKAENDLLQAEIDKAEKDKNYKPKY